MPTYATQADAEAYIEGLVVDNADGFARLLERAERDVDELLGPLHRRADTGLKLDPADLPVLEADALARATCAQAEHLLRTSPTGSSSSSGRVVKRVQGPDFTVDYADAEVLTAGIGARFGSRVAAELAPLARYNPRFARARP